MEITRFSGIIVSLLDKETAQKNIKRLVDLFRQIPCVDYYEEDVIAESKGMRFFHAKWKHSLVAFENNEPIAVLVAYEREPEESSPYSIATLYISELSVITTRQRQGIAGKLLDTAISYNNSVGFLVLSGNFNYSLQTNSAEFNKHVVNLYASKGFNVIGYKEYNNRKDVIMRLYPQ